MKFDLIKSLLASLMIAVSAYSNAADPVPLTNSQMDLVSAGAYSQVYGEASADSGMVSVDTTTQGKVNPNGMEMSKSKVVVKAEGSGIEGYAAGQSGDENVATFGEGGAAADQGRLRIVVKTKVRTKSDGTSVSKTTVKSKVMSPAAGVKIVTRSTNVARSS